MAIYKCKKNITTIYKTNLHQKQTYLEAIVIKIHAHNFKLIQKLINIPNSLKLGFNGRESAATPIQVKS
jgi:hypothetical protein